MVYSVYSYNKMVESGEIQPSPIFCKCVMCNDSKGGHTN